MLSGIHTAVIIFNPSTGPHRHRRLAELAAAQRILAASGIHAELAATTGPGSATDMAHAAVSSGKQLVVGCGGDGTINEIANGLAGSQVPLAILPAGTANVLAKELGLPWNIPAAAKLIPSAQLCRIALGLAASPELPGGKRYFVSVAGAGPDGSMVYATSQGVKQSAGILAYWLEGLRHFFVYRMAGFEVAVAGHAFAATLAVVSRTKHYGGPFCITTGASLFDDCFEVGVFATRSRFRYLVYIPAVWLSRHRRMRDVHFFQADTVACRPVGRARVYAQTDGEPAGHLPIEFRIVPDALTLVVPKQAA